MVTMTLLSALLVLAFFVMLAFALVRIGALLRSIGGTPTSYLAKLRLGLTALKSRQRHWPPSRPISWAICAQVMRRARNERPGFSVVPSISER